MMTSMPSSPYMLARKMLRIKGKVSSTQYRSEEKRFRMRPVGVVSKKVTVAWQQGNKKSRAHQLLPAESHLSHLHSWTMRRTAGQNNLQEPQPALDFLTITFTTLWSSRLWMTTAARMVPYAKRKARKMVKRELAPAMLP